MVGGFLAAEERLGKIRGRKTRTVRSYGRKIDGILYDLGTCDQHCPCPWDLAAVLAPQAQDHQGQPVV